MTSVDAWLVAIAVGVLALSVWDAAGSALMRRRLHLYDTLLSAREGPIRAGTMRVRKEPDVTGFNIVLSHDSGLALRYPIYDDEIEELVAILRAEPPCQRVWRS